MSLPMGMIPPPGMLPPPGMMPPGMMPPPPFGSMPPMPPGMNMFFMFLLLISLKYNV